MKITFGRSESWVSGWRGKESSAPIRVDGVEVGQIEGSENSATPGAMSYGINLNINAPYRLLHSDNGLYSLKAAKAHVLGNLSRTA